MPKSKPTVSPYLQKDVFPGDTVKVQDPPTSNGAGTDAFDEGKGIKVPPGARGEYTERPPGNYGGPGGTIGVDPHKFDVNDVNYRRRNAIPPMFLPAISSRQVNVAGIIERVRASLSNDLRRPKYQGNENPMAGHCYVASEALYHLLGGKSAGYTPYFIRHEGEPHWFLKGPTGVLDITSEQFKSPVPYDQAIAKGFLTSQPSARAQSVINAVVPHFSMEAAQEEIDNEDEPRDEKRDKRNRDFERGLLKPGEPSRPETGLPEVGPIDDQGGITPERPDLPPSGAEEVEHAAPLSLDQLNQPEKAVEPIYSITGSVNPGLDTTQNLKFYNLDPLVQNPQITDQMLSDLGFRVETFSFNPERFRLPKLKMQGYEKDVVWIYDPEVEHGSFKDSEYTRAWRVFHEVGHGITEDFMHARYGPSRREGRLGVESTSMRGVPPKQVQVTVRPLTLMEAQRAVEWEDVAFRAQQMLLNMYGVSITPEDFAKEYNVNIADALFRTLTGDFGDPGAYGYVPAEKIGDLRGMLAFLQAQEQEIAAETGRAPTEGIDLRTWRPVSDDEIRQALERRLSSKRRAFSVYPFPRQQPETDERLLLQIPRDVQERYSDLNRRVNEYVKSLKINTLDMYDFPSDPPESWVEEERKNVQVDWDDDVAWSTYLGKLSHDDVADWIGLEALDAERISALTPDLHVQHALEAGNTEDFASWFRSRRPALTDRNLSNYIRETAKAFPNDGVGKGYGGHWRRRNHEMVREIATSRARERHDRYLREVAYQDYVRPHLRDHFDAISRAKQERQPLNDTVTSLHALPHEGVERETVDSFRDELDGIVNEGVHALDLYRPPVSREDRMFGDMEFQGEKWVPVRRIEGEFLEGAAASPVPVPLYRYGDRYFLVHASDKRNVSPEMLMIRAHVFAVTPGSSIVKKASGSWDRKARALSAAINEIKTGSDREAVFQKYGREFGPGLRKAVGDYLYIVNFSKKSDGGGGSSGSTIGDATCSSFSNQSPDNCGGCTFNSGTGGYEFGYGDGACLLTHLFLNAPDKGFGRGDPAAYDPEHTPGKPSVQDRPRNRRTDPRLP